MKNLIAVLLLSMLVAGTAVAQSKTVRANIPFDFVAGQKSLPAGSYTVRSLGASGDVLGIKTENSNGAMAMSHPVISSKRAERRRCCSAVTPGSTSSPRYGSRANKRGGNCQSPAANGCWPKITRRFGFLSSPS